MTTRCGTVSIAGRPNVGKSTLLNHLVGQKLSITAHKPQTTRHSIVGVTTEGELQIVYVDTPGIHVSDRQVLNQVLNRTASAALFGVDCIILMVQALVWNDDDQRAFDTVCQSGVPFFIAVNKVDTIRHKDELLPFLAALPAAESLLNVFIVSARTGNGVDALKAAVAERMPEAEFRFGEDELTDRSSRFLAAEAVREPLTRQLGAELPYALTVEIEQYDDTPAIAHIGAVIWVDRASQKGIVIGKGGQQLKAVGQHARRSLENLLGKQVNLKLWVRVKEGWADDARALRTLGYDNT